MPEPLAARPRLAVQEGKGGECLGKQLGSATVNVGSFFIPGGGAAEAANVAGHVGEPANVAGSCR